MDIFIIFIYINIIEYIYSKLIKAEFFCGIKLEMFLSYLDTYHSHHFSFQTYMTSL